MAELYNIVYPDRLIFPHIGAEKRQNKAFLHLCLKKIHKENLNIGVNPTHTEKKCH